MVERALGTGIIIVAVVLAALAAWWQISYTAGLTTATIQLAASPEFKNANIPIPQQLDQLKTQAPFVIAMLWVIIPALLFVELFLGYAAGRRMERALAVKKEVKQARGAKGKGKEEEPEEEEEE